uniref:Uncharacterized protein n=1 Tax=Glossina brevipalpis TaxID=37001 RepID=A0A1A9WK53_9MUSC
MDEPVPGRICGGRSRDFSRIIGMLIGFLLALPHFFQSFFSPFASDSRGDSSPTRTGASGGISADGGYLRSRCIIMDCNIPGDYDTAVTRLQVELKKLAMAIKSSHL